MSSDLNGFDRNTAASMIGGRSLRFNFQGDNLGSFKRLGLIVCYSVLSDQSKKTHETTPNI